MIWLVGEIWDGGCHWTLTSNLHWAVEEPIIPSCGCSAVLACRGGADVASLFNTYSARRMTSMSLGLSGAVNIKNQTY